ncbi:Fc.00g093310.m01.CDS01 [Cosmosporella sp. VM-42]
MILPHHSIAGHDGGVWHNSSDLTVISSFSGEVGQSRDPTPRCGHLPPELSHSADVLFPSPSTKAKRATKEAYLMPTLSESEVAMRSHVTRTDKVDTEVQESPDLTDTAAAQARIDNLEHIVRSLLESRQHAQGRVDTPSTGTTGTTASDTDRSYGNAAGGDNNAGGRRPQENPTIQRTSNTSIKIKADYKQHQAVDEGHWALLLNEIGEVRSHLRAAQRHYEEHAKRVTQIPQQPCDDSGPVLLFGSERKVSWAEILAQLPSKHSCDIIVARFFDRLYPAIHILHESTFHKQYSRFWADRRQAPIAWVALLFAILRIAVLDYLREDDAPVEFAGKCQDLAFSFRNRLTDCLILADYLHPQEFLIEALCLHMYGEYVSSRDARSSVWVLIGMIVRLAMRIGYHQPLQPALFSSPFQAEMRRRTWAFIRQADVMLSFQMGLPSMIELPPDEACLPRNIYDDEYFEEGCTVLPTTLPNSEPTQVSFLLAKTRLAFGFARALKEISHADTTRWERILEIDREIRSLYDNIPDRFKLSQHSGRDSLVLISSRFVLASIHHISLCVIHSRFLETAKSDYKYSYSRRVCLSSAMSILHFQAIQNKNIPVNGRLRSLTNYQTSLCTHHFLLGATIISAALCSSAPIDTSTRNISSNDAPTRAEMIKALGLSARIFNQMKDYSMEAYKAADVLQMLVRKFEGGDPKAVPNDMQSVQADRSSWPNENGVYSAVPNVRSFFRGPANALNEMSATLPGSDYNAESIILPTDTNQMLRGLSRVSQTGTHTNPPLMESHGSLETTDSYLYQGWPKTQESGSYDQYSPFSQTFLETETSSSWVMAENDGDSILSMMA